MRTFNFCLRALAMLCGVLLIATQIVLNLEALGPATAISGLGLAAVAVPIAMAMAVAVLEHCSAERRYGLAAVALVVLVCGISHTSIVALERGVHGRERTAAAKRSENAGYNLAMKAHADAIARVRALETAESATCRTAGKPCTAARANLEAARTWAATKQGELAQAGAPVVTDGMAARFGTAATAIDIWHPILLPLALELGGLVLIAFAFRREREANVSSQAASAPATKEDEAVQIIRDLLGEQRGDRAPTVREIAAETGIPPTTCWRALRRIRSAA